MADGFGVDGDKLVADALLRYSSTEESLSTLQRMSNSLSEDRTLSLSLSENSDLLLPVLDETPRPTPDVAPLFDAASHSKTPATLVAEPEEEALLRQASWVIEQLQGRRSQLSQREQEAARALASLEQREQELQAARDLFEQHCRAERETVAQASAELDRRRTDVLSRELSLQQREGLLISAEADLTLRQASWKEEADRQFAAERLEIERDRQLIAADGQKLQELATLQLQEQHARSVQQKEELQSEREKLWHDLSSEWESSRRQFELEKAAWVTQRDAQFAELATARESLDQLKHELESARGSQSADLQRERALLENRLRFQQEHLEKTRHELEHAQQELRRERQLHQQRVSEEQQLHVRRQEQLEAYRAVLDEREKSLDREHDTVLQARSAFSATADADRELLLAERQAWQQEQSLQQAELRHQQEGLKAHAELLDSRKQRLDALRTELEATHRQTLELRLAVEESWANLTHKLGEANARRQVDEARAGLEAYSQQLVASQMVHRTELQELEQRLDEQRMHLQQERQALHELVAQRGADLQLTETRLREKTQQIHDHERTWQAARDRWLREKLEAERVIRQLLAAVCEQHEPQIFEIPPSRAA